MKKPKINLKSAAEGVKMVGGMLAGIGGGAIAGHALHAIASLAPFTGFGSAACAAVAGIVLADKLGDVAQDHLEKMVDTTVDVIDTVGEIIS